MPDLINRPAERAGTAALDNDAIAVLRASVSGEVLLPGEAGFEAAASAWNLNAVHAPQVVVLPEHPGDVPPAVRFAAGAGLGVGVMATGHGTAQRRVDGMLINTRRLGELRVDPWRRTVRVGAGVLWRDVVAAAAPYGLAGLPGSSTGVGVVGSSMGGGFGWLGRRHGLAAHAIVAADLVLADGSEVTVTAEQHPDLFWAVRGGGGNVGVVTALELALVEVPTVYAGNLYYPLTRSRDVLEFYAEWTRTAPDELTAAATFRRFPPLPGVPEALRGQTLVALRGCHCGAPASAAALVDQARTALGPPLLDTFGPTAVADLAVVSLDPVEPLAALNHSELLAELPPGAIDALLELAGPDVPFPLVMLELRQLGGALGGPPDALSPLAHRSVGFSLNAIGITPTPQQAAAVAGHLAQVACRLRPFVTGESFLNFLDLDGATPERIRAAFTERDWRRLTAIKTAVDPDNLFRLNRNVPPTTTERP